MPQAFHVLLALACCQAVFEEGFVRVRLLGGPNGAVEMPHPRSNHINSDQHVWHEFVTAAARLLGTAQHRGKALRLVDDDGSEVSSLAELGDSVTVIRAARETDFRRAPRAGFGIIERRGMEARQGATIAKQLKAAPLMHAALPFSEACHISPI